MKKKRFRGTAGLLLLASGSLPSRAELYNSTDVGTHALTTPSYAVHQGAGSLGHHHHLEAPQNEFEFELMLGADSRYVSEGRDNLPDGSGILWGNMGAHAHVMGGAVFAELLGIESLDSDYNEVGLTLGYERDMGPVTSSAGLTILDFPALGENDLEATLSTEWRICPRADLAAELVWCRASPGWYGEITARYRLKEDDNLILMASLLAGFNGGYLPDESDGLNYMGLRIEATIGISEHVKGLLHTTYAHPFGHEGHQDFRGLLWVGGALALMF